jgi:hypothetical protein
MYGQTLSSFRNEIMRQKGDRLVVGMMNDE